MKKLLIKLSLVVVAIALAMQAKADFTWDFSYSGAGVTASGTFITSETLIPNVGGLGLNGYQITGISGFRNGLAITGLDLNPNFPDTELNVLGVIFDNGLITPPQLDYWGLSYFVGGDEFNLYSQDFPFGGGHFEAVNGDYGNAVPVDVTINSALVPEASTMIAGALMVLPLGVSALRILRNRKTV